MSKAVIKKVDFKKYQRIIVTSDIHGDYDGFCHLIEQLDFKKTDALVIVGDILDRGSQSLPLLRKVMHLYQNGNIYMVLGNHDTIFQDWFSGKESAENICDYILHRQYGILKEIAAEMSMPIVSQDDLKAFQSAVQKKYAKEIAFLNGLPHIIESENAVFVHAGLKVGSLYEQEVEDCLAMKAFAKGKHHFEKTVIVGHWPVSNYRDAEINANIYNNEAMNVCSMDGGNSMKRWGQINYLVITKGGMLQSGYVDTLPKIKVLDPQAETQSSITLTFPRTELMILETHQNQKRCFVPFLNQEMTFSKDKIYFYKDKYYCSDFTTYHLPLKVGEVVSFCQNTGDGILVKRNGIVGLYSGRYIFLDK